MARSVSAAVNAETITSCTESAFSRAAGAARNAPAIAADNDPASAMRGRNPIESTAWRRREAVSNSTMASPGLNAARTLSRTSATLATDPETSAAMTRAIPRCAGIITGRASAAPMRTIAAARMTSSRMSASSMRLLVAVARVSGTNRAVGNGMARARRVTIRWSAAMAIAAASAAPRYAGARKVTRATGYAAAASLSTMRRTACSTGSAPAMTVRYAAPLPSHASRIASRQLEKARA